MVSSLVSMDISIPMNTDCVLWALPGAAGDPTHDSLKFITMFSSTAVKMPVVGEFGRESAIQTHHQHKQPQSDVHCPWCADNQVNE